MDFLTETQECDSLFSARGEAPTAEQSLPTKAVLQERAATYRFNPTFSESKFRKRLSTTGLKFEFQSVLGVYIADFVIPSKMLVIEIDGDTHNERQEYDERRTKKLKSFGFRVLRIRNEEVDSWDLKLLNDIPDVDNFKMVYRFALKRAAKDRNYLLQYLQVAPNKRKQFLRSKRQSAEAKAENRRQQAKGQPKQKHTVWYKAWRELPPAELPTLVYEKPKRAIKVIKAKDVVKKVSKKRK